MKMRSREKGASAKHVFRYLARLYAEEGKSVLAVDVDPDANLGLALGFSAKRSTKLFRFPAEKIGCGNVPVLPTKFWKVFQTKSESFRSS
jgi:CO dehydrogenase nickel-insertion accessory protein CooC1